MKRVIKAMHHLKEKKGSIKTGLRKIFGQIARKYEMLYMTPEEDYVLKGDSCAFRVNGHNIYRVIIDTRDSRLYLQCIEDAWRKDNGEEYYDTAVDYKDGVVDYPDMFRTIVKWVNECEADDPNYTKYYDENDNPIEASESLDDNEEEFDDEDDFPGVSYVVYELDPDDGSEVDSVEGFDSEEEAISFAKSCSFPTHVVFVPNEDPDDDPNYAEYIEYAYSYEPYEVIWESTEAD